MGNDNTETIGPIEDIGGDSQGEEIKVRSGNQEIDILANGGLILL